MKLLLDNHPTLQQHNKNSANNTILGSSRIIDWVLTSNNNCLVTYGMGKFKDKHENYHPALL
jgi:hypothetical protein